MSEFNLKPSYTINDYRIFPEAIFRDLHVSDCNDTVNGICLTTKNLNECLDKCTNSNGKCVSGYFIQTESDKGICVPIDYYHTELNDAYRLRRKTIYPELRGFPTYSFINHSKTVFPPNNANEIFYFDSCYLEDVKTKKKLEMRLIDPKIPYEEAYFGEHSPINIQILPLREALSSTQEYLPVKKDSFIIFNIPGTPLLLGEPDEKKDEHEPIKWIPSLSVSVDVENKYKIIPVDKNQKNLFYDQEIFIYHEKGFLSTDKNGNLIFSDKKGIFKLVPNFKVYYCDLDNKINEIELIKCDKNEIEATFNNFIVYRNKTCWGKKSSNNNNIILYFLLLFVVILLFFAKK